MRLQVRMPQIDPSQIVEPETCPYCGSEAIRACSSATQRKPVRDLHHEMVNSQRYRCLSCQRRFRAYPVGVSHRDQSDAVKGMSVMLYVLGLSYGGVADFLRAIGIAIGKTSVYYNVQAAGEKSRLEQVRQVVSGGKRSAIGSDGSYVKVKGEKVGVQVVVDDTTGELLGLELIVSEKVEEIRPLIRQIARIVDADVLVSDDLDSYQKVADELDLGHQICLSHVQRNVEELKKSLLNQNDAYDNLYPVKPEQLLKDLNILEGLVCDLPRYAKQVLAFLYEHYKKTPEPRPGHKHPVAYRMKRLIERLWHQWDRLVFHENYPQMDGTNNASERAIGWWLKERYRTMRGYKRLASIKNVVSLTALLGAAHQPYDLAGLYA